MAPSEEGVGGGVGRVQLDRVLQKTRGDPGVLSGGFIALATKPIVDAVGVALPARKEQR